MGKLQVSRFERLAARTYSIKGPGALVDLDETVLGVINLERQGGPESWLMQGWETFGVHQNLNASVGNYSWILISNPVGSGRIIVVDGWQRNSALGLGTWITRGVPPGFVNFGSGIGLDTRIPQLRESTADNFYFYTNIGSFGTELVESTTTNYQDNQPIILGPDGSLAWRSSVVNEQLNLGWRWAERDAQPFELQ